MPNKKKPVITMTKVTPFVRIAPCLQQAIDILELLYGSIRCPSWRKLKPWPEDDEKRIGDDISVLEYSPYKSVLLDQSRLIRKLVTLRKMPAVWFIRTHRPVTVLLSAICEQAEVSISSVFNGELTEQDFDSLISVVGTFAGSPLWVCDASHSGDFRKALAGLDSSTEISCAFCDWILEGSELAAVNRMAQETAISFYCPR
jgi:hypothetical protein